VLPYAPVEPEWHHGLSRDGGHAPRQLLGAKRRHNDEPIRCVLVAPGGRASENPPRRGFTRRILAADF
jgi:hypothetical protein